MIRKEQAPVQQIMAFWHMPHHMTIRFTIMSLAALLLLSACGGGPAQPAAEAEAEATPTTQTATDTPEPQPTATETTATPQPTQEEETEATTAAPTPDTPADEADSATATSEPPTATAVPPTPTPAGPVALSSGSFTFVDDLHSATGTTTIIEQPDGTRLVRLEENFSVTFGPDLFVWLSGHPQPRSSAETQDQGYVNLGGLQSRSGAQEYTIPADVNLDNYESVVIWCRAFSQVMSSAELLEE
jgi:ABC-type Fe3+-hydroxamate transport system substrate-binding protein